jgi:hypothetical protein
MDTLFLVTFVITVLFGLVFIIIPGALLGVLGVSVEAAGTALARLFGSALLGFPILLWFGRLSHNKILRKGLVYSLFVYFLISLVVLTLAMLNRLMNALGWSVVALHALLAAWFGYFLVKR